MLDIMNDDAIWPKTIVSVECRPCFEVVVNGKNRVGGMVIEFPTR